MKDDRNPERMPRGVSLKTMKKLIEMGEGSVSAEEAFSNVAFSEEIQKMLDEADLEFSTSANEDPIHSWSTFKVLNEVVVSTHLMINALLVESNIWRSLFPSKTKLTDAILLFVCKPDDAEVAAGDLLEELEKVKARHGNWYCNIWFTWELTLLVIAKGRKRFTKSVFGPLVDMLKRKSS